MWSAGQGSRRRGWLTGADGECCCVGTHALGRRGAALGARAERRRGQSVRCTLAGRLHVPSRHHDQSVAAALVIIGKTLLTCVLVLFLGEGLCQLAGQVSVQPQAGHHGADDAGHALQRGHVCARQACAGRREAQHSSRAGGGTANGHDMHALHSELGGQPGCCSTTCLLLGRLPAIGSAASARTLVGFGSRPQHARHGTAQHGTAQHSSAALQQTTPARSIGRATPARLLWVGCYGVHPLHVGFGGGVGLLVDGQLHAPLLLGERHGGEEGKQGVTSVPSGPPSCSVVQAAEAAQRPSQPPHPAALHSGHRSPPRSRRAAAAPAPPQPAAPSAPPAGAPAAGCTA